MCDVTEITCLVISDTFATGMSHSNAAASFVVKYNKAFTIHGNNCGEAAQDCDVTVCALVV